MNRLTAGAFASLALGATMLVSLPAMAEQPRFESAEAAMAAMVEALKASDPEPILALLGPEHREAIIGGDPAGLREGLAELQVAASEAAVLADGEDGAKIMLLGREAWPMPVPLVQEDQGWRFDTEAGIEELDDRRVGANELTAIEALQLYVDAQAEYAEADRDGDRVLEYAQKVVSSEGKRDGLFWPPGEDGVLSPLGPRVAEADAYLKEHYRQGEPFHGYYFKVLAEQGANAPGGRYGYVINGNMIAGFAMIAWPADYGHSGVMTFIVNQEGVVHEKDLGEETEKLAPTITAYDPDSTWSAVTED